MQKDVLWPGTSPRFVTRSAPWPAIVSRYRELPPAAGVAPMVDFVERIAASHYADSLHPAMSMFTLLIAQTPEFGFDEEVLKVELSQGVMRFEFAEHPLARTRWRTSCAPADAFAVLERFLHRKKWFVEYCSTDGLPARLPGSRPLDPPPPRREAADAWWSSLIERWTSVWRSAGR